MTSSGISLIGSVSKGWLARALNVAFNRDYYFNLDTRLEIDRRCHEYTRTELADLNIIHTESNLGQRAHLSESQILVGGIQPNMILGMLIGAAFIPNDAMDADISPTPLQGRDPGNLPEPASLLEHDLVNQFNAQIAQVQSEGRLTPIPPFFWDGSGRATLHGTLTTAQKFLGENLFIGLKTAPEKILPVMDWITESFLVLVRHYSEVGRLPVTAVHIGECSGCMVHPDMFSQWVVPQAARIAEALGPVRFHSCGPSTHLLKSIKTIPGLAWLDLGGETAVGKVRETFGHQFPVEIAPLPGDLSAGSSQPILQWAAKVVQENQGGPLQITYHLEPDYQISHVRALRDYLGAGSQRA